MGKNRRPPTTVKVLDGNHRKPKPRLTYSEACHAMQTGVKMEQERYPNSESPKHLRTGINSAMCSHTALVKLLIANGIIDEQEYHEAMTEEMNLEVERYEQRLSTPELKVTLG